MKNYRQMIIELLEKIENPKVLKDIYNLISGVYKHYVSGTWET